MANIEAANVKGENNWALLLDPDGFIAEGSGDNIFFVKDGVVITPEPRNILVGISRDYVIEICGSLGIPCKEKNIEPYEAYTADESFMTATPFCLLPVGKVNGYEMEHGVLGPITKAIHDEWSKRVGLDIFKQIRSFSSEVQELSRNHATPYQFN